MTDSTECPIGCGKTRKHPERNNKTDYCCDCAEEFPAAELTVIRWEDDPYEQCDDGMMITICSKCRDNRPTPE